MSETLHLTISTPAGVLADRDDVTAVRAEDPSGSFGVLPGHADFLTVLGASVLRWRDARGAHFCALGGGVLSVASGQRVRIACRQGVVGDDLAALERDVATMRASELDEARRTRAAQTQLHARAIRQIMRHLRPDLSAASLEGDGGGGDLP